MESLLFHCREKRHQAFQELIEGVMAGQTNRRFPSLISRRHLNSPEGWVRNRRTCRTNFDANEN
jgi:hypothetical protein